VKRNRKDGDGRTALLASGASSLIVTAGAAGSSLVVPAIHFERVERISMKPMTVQKGAFLHPFSLIRAVFNVERWTSHNHAVGFEYPLQSVYLFGGVAFLKRQLARR
jgi:hypothetical protein